MWSAWDGFELFSVLDDRQPGARPGPRGFVQQGVEKRRLTVLPAPGRPTTPMLSAKSRRAIVAGARPRRARSAGFRMGEVWGATR
jgi:hypothetical protein